MYCDRLRAEFEIQSAFDLVRQPLPRLVVRFTYHNAGFDSVKQSKNDPMEVVRITTRGAALLYRFSCSRAPQNLVSISLVLSPSAMLNGGLALILH